MNLSEQRTGMVLVIIASLSFSTLPIIIKQIYTIDLNIDAANLLMWRFIIAVPLMWVLAFLNRAPEESRRKLPRYSLLGTGTLFVPNALLAFNALGLIPASTYSLVFYSYPAVIVLISVFFLGETLSRRGWLALVLTLIGVILTIPNLQNGLVGSNPLGILYTLLNIGGYSLYFILYTRVLREQNAMLEATAWHMTGALFILSAVVLAQGVVVPSNITSWLFIITLAVVGTILPITTLFAGARKIGAARAAIFSTVEPINTVILAFLLLGETLLPLQAVGGVLVVAGVILLQMGTKTAKQKAAQQQFQPTTEHS
jgi:drug/metabolite transporter (DMT)-like permease